MLIDSGANIGQFLLYLLNINALEIHGFEPVAEEEYRTYMAQFGYKPYRLASGKMVSANDRVVALTNLYYFPE